jgi:hypothetical protein
VCLPSSRARCTSKIESPDLLDLAAARSAPPPLDPDSIPGAELAGGHESSRRRWSPHAERRHPCGRRDGGCLAGSASCRALSTMGYCGARRKIWIRSVRAREDASRRRDVLRSPRSDESGRVAGSERDESSSCPCCARSRGLHPSDYCRAARGARSDGRPGRGTDTVRRRFPRWVPLLASAQRLLG